MSDKELLELAARAAGISIYFDDIGQCCQRVPGDQLSTYLWEPLEDDGDALRLAVKLRIHLYFNDTYVDAGVKPNWAPPIEIGDDPYAATRRAIVRAAAAIGKAGTTDGRGE